MRRFTKRFHRVDVATLSTLREHLEWISTPGCKFEVDKLSRDRVTVRCESFASGKRRDFFVVLPAYATGHPDDVPGNPNVVLDPLDFLKTETHADREVFAPLLGHDLLEHYEKMHPQENLPASRCC